MDDQGDPQATIQVRGLAARALGSAGKNKDGLLLYQAMADELNYVRVAAARATIDFLRRRNELQDGST